YRESTSNASVTQSSTADWTAHRLLSHTAIDEMLFHIDGRAGGYRLDFSYNTTTPSSIVNDMLIRHQQARTAGYSG
ncbi:MAG TPA: hypothetical protein VMI06_00925, partial [Terriglobia bacterium]|nr:hypothetical protein [Terriglobia bacterium]